MEWWILLPAIMLPWVTGALLVYAVDARLSLRALPYAAAFGYALGIVLAAVLFSLQLRVFGVASPRWSAALLVGIAISCGLVLQQRVGETIPESSAVESKKSLLWYGLLAWVMLKVALVIFEVIRQPVLSWDAWTTWLMRSRIWVETGDYVPFTEPAGALARDLGYSIEAWAYPELVSWIGAWSAAWGSAGWNESNAVLPWLALAIVLPLGLYAALRRVAVPSTLAIAVVWGLLSLPLVATHLAMAGYADIWLATSLGFALMAGFQWLRTGQLPDLIVTLLFVAIVALLKPEGLVWAALFPVAFLVVRSGAKTLLALSMAGLLVMLILFQLDGVRVSVPILGTLTFGWPASINEVGWHLWIYGNWQLLFWLVAAILLAVLLTARRHPMDRARLGLLAWVMVSLGGFLFLFLWTDSAEWARLGTANNRVLLHLVPGFICWLAVELTENPLLSRFTRPT
jgi:hypothetical protein